MSIDNINANPGDLLFIGDVYLEKMGKLDLPGHIVFNHEYVISDESDVPSANKVNLISKANFIPGTFNKAEKLYANFSNNHTMDFGESAFKRTLTLLEDSGVYCFGHHFKKQSEVIHTLENIKFCLLGYNMTAPSDTMEPESVIALMKEDICCAKNKGAQRILITIHFGDEHEPICSESQKMVARTAIDYGGDILLGHHTHCIQNAEIYKGKYIFYGLGNTWFLKHSTPAYFDHNGNMQRIFRARETRWNTESLLVIYNLLTERVNIMKASCRKGSFKLLGNTNLEAINKSCINKHKYTGTMRRYYLFAISNMFCDNQIIDFNSFKHKFLDKKSYYKKKKNKFKGK